MYRRAGRGANKPLLDVYFAGCNGTTICTCMCSHVTIVVHAARSASSTAASSLPGFAVMMLSRWRTIRACGVHWRGFGQLTLRHCVVLRNIRLRCIGKTYTALHISTKLYLHESIRRSQSAHDIGARTRAYATLSSGSGNPASGSVEH